MSSPSSSPAFLAAIRDADRRRIASLLADDVVFNSPVATYRGAERAGEVLVTVAEVLDDLQLVRELADGRETVTFVTGRIGEDEVDGVLAQTAGEDGRLVEVTLMLRPLQGLLAGVEQMRRRLGRSGSGPVGV